MVEVVPADLVSKAVESLMKWENSRKQSREKSLLLEDDSLIYLVVSLKKTSPDHNRVNPIQIPIPNPIFDLDHGELCLFIDDRKGKLKQKETKLRIAEEGIPISKVIPLSKLRTDYKEYEAKRKLCGSYDLFLADKSVIPALPKLLGKSFFKKKKHPIPVDLLRKKDWKKQVQNACQSTFLYLKGGTCCVVKVGKLSQSKEEVCENVIHVIDAVSSHVPKKWKNIRSLYLKTLDSVPLPLHQALPDLPRKISVA